MKIKDDAMLAESWMGYYQELLNIEPPTRGNGCSSTHRREAPWSSGRTLALDAARPRSIPGLGHY